MLPDSSIIRTRRLNLIALSPAFYEASLAGQTAEAERILGVRIPADWFGETDLMRLRLGQLQTDAALQPWLLRAIVLRDEPVMAGHIGFHTAPGPDYLDTIAPGGVEFGYSVFASFRRRGIAGEAIDGLMQWAASDRGVRQFVVSISPLNVPSLRLAARFGFQKVGSHVDEVDGIEDIYVRQHAASQPGNCSG